MKDLLRALAAISDALDVPADVRDLLDGLWLAHIGVIDTSLSTASDSVALSASAKARADQAPVKTSPSPTNAVSDGPLPLYLDDDTAPGPSQPVRAPAAPPLTHARSILRALRPLRSRHTRPGTDELDVEATAEAVTDTGLIELIFRRRSERRWSLQILVDEGGAWPVLESSVRALVNVITRLGAWRSVTVSSLPDGQAPTLRKGMTPQRDTERRTPRSWRRLRDPTHRTVSLVITDATRRGWCDGRVPTLLRGLSSPTALLMTLPATLWHRTALRHGLDPDDPLRASLLTSARLREYTGPVALVSLNPARLHAWAGSLADGRRYRPRTRLSTAPAPPSRPTPRWPGAAIVDTFLRHATPQTARLALLLAWSPAISVDVIRILRTAMVRDAGLEHEAELFTSGLLRALPGEPLRLDLDRDVRTALRRHGRTSDGHAVFSRLSSWLQDHWEQWRQFSAALRDPLGAGADAFASGAFAEVTADLLTDLGGPWARMTMPRTSRAGNTPHEGPSEKLTVDRLRSRARNLLKYPPRTLVAAIKDALAEYPLFLEGIGTFGNVEFTNVSPWFKETLMDDDAILVTDTPGTLLVHLPGDAMARCRYERTGHDDVMNAEGDVIPETWNREYTATLNLLWTAELRIQSFNRWTLRRLEVEKLELSGERELDAEIGGEEDVVPEPPIPDEEPPRMDPAIRSARETQQLKVKLLALWNQIQATLALKLKSREDLDVTTLDGGTLAELGIFDSEAADVYEGLRHVRNTTVHSESSHDDEESSIRRTIDILMNMADGLLEDMTFVERLQVLSLEERDREIDDLISNSYDEITQSEAFNDAESETNATMFIIDEYDILDVSFTDEACEITISYSASGDQLEERMYAGDEIRGEAVAVIDADGNVSYRDIKASVRHDDVGYDDNDDDTTDDHDGEEDDEG